MKVPIFRSKLTVPGEKCLKAATVKAISVFYLATNLTEAMFWCGWSKCKSETDVLKGIYRVRNEGACPTHYAEQLTCKN